VLAVGAFSDSIDFGQGPFTNPNPRKAPPEVGPSAGFAILLDAGLDTVRSRALGSPPGDVKLGCDGALYVTDSGFVARGM
jgi:hypothetical protein